MTRERLARGATVVAAGAAALFLAVLALDWQRTTVKVTGAVDVEAASSGFAGWGWIAAVFAALVLGIAVRDLGRERRTAAAHPLAVGALALGLIVTATFAALSGDAQVDVAGVVAVDATETLWPAWVGLGLAIAAGLATLVPLAVELDIGAERQSPRTA
jgi:hypothetical protein